MENSSYFVIYKVFSTLSPPPEWKIVLESKRRYKVFSLEEARKFVNERKENIGVKFKILVNCSNEKIVVNETYFFIKFRLFKEVGAE